MKTRVNGKFLNQEGENEMIVVGKFKEIYKDDSLPSIYDFVSEKHYKDKDLVLKYLKNGNILQLQNGTAFLHFYTVTENESLFR